MVVYGPTHPSPPTPPPVQLETPVASEAATSTPPASDSAFEKSLWGVLTQEERQFFAQQAELGPLTYGPKGAMTETVDVPKGQRLDVRG